MNWNFDGCFWHSTATKPASLMRDVSFFIRTVDFFLVNIANMVNILVAKVCAVDSKLFQNSWLRVRMSILLVRHFIFSSESVGNVSLDSVVVGF